MRYVRWIFNIVVVTIVLGFLHYALPQWDTVRITNTREVQTQPTQSFFCPFGEPEGQGVRDQSQVQAVFPGGSPMVYRNEDQPFYLKFDSADVQTIASSYTSSDADPTWVAVKNYGWRLQICSEYPNVLKIKEVDGPDVTVTPWISYITLFLVFVAGWTIRVRWVRFRKARIDPIFDAIDDWIDDIFRKKE